MPVRIKSKTLSQDSATPSGLDVETNLINLADQSDDYIVEGQVDLNNLEAGDTVVLKAYIAVDGTNQRLSDSATYSGVQSVPIIRVVAHTIPYNGKFRVTVTQTAGTVRAFPFAFVTQLMEVI